MLIVNILKFLLYFLVILMHCSHCIVVLDFESRRNYVRQQPQRGHFRFAYVRNARHCALSDFFSENRFGKSAKTTTICYMPNFVQKGKYDSLKVFILYMIVVFYNFGLIVLCRCFFHFRVNIHQ